MSRIVYDLLFITHIPSFYKVNLYNALAKHKKVAAIFLAPESSIRSQDFMGESFQFDCFFVNSTNFETRSKIKSCFKILKLLFQLKARKVLLGGWECPEFWVALFFNRKNVNALVLESSVHESKTQGLSAKLKNFFLRRVHTVYASGLPHQTLLSKLQYNGNVIITQGVGLFPLAPTRKNSSETVTKFLYVGRLSEEKNIFLLLHAFAHAKEFQLTIVGKGPLASALQKGATDNVSFIEHVPNDEIGEVYREHDGFILPSLKEPWGLVVEEAIYYGLPVLVSNKVGCAQDIVEKHHLGLVFDPNNVNSLLQAMYTLQREYTTYKTQCDTLDFVAKNNQQVQQYLL